MPDTAPVTVVMPVYNSANVVGDAVESILNQTFSHFEFIIVDDGSTDDTAAILHEYAARDDRIKLYSQENAGLILSLNRYCRIAGGKYIARMDADDISLSTRLEKQFRFLEAHPEIGVLGTWIQDVDENRRPGATWPVPKDSNVVGWFLMFGNCLAHSSVMMRRDVLDRVGYYRPAALHVEDYDLWIRASEVAGLANIPEVLLHYRISGQSVSSRNLSLQERHAADLKCALVGGLLCRSVRRDTIEALQHSAAGLPVSQPEAATDAASLLAELHSAYVGKIRLTRNERAEIALDIFRRLWLLAHFAKGSSFSKRLGIWLRSFRFAPLLFSLPNVKKALSLTAWVLKYRGRVFISQRRQT